jgi:hypothetical protein
MFFKPIELNIGTFKVNNGDHAGAISFGTNVKIGRNVKGKKTQGYGQQHADFVLRGYNEHFSLDDDMVDHFTQKNNK